MDTAIVWFKQDLRLSDNPALYYATLENNNIIPLYILDETLPDLLGQAQQWWLNHSLVALQDQFHQLKSNLILKRGNPYKILSELCKDYKVSTIYWNRCYEPLAIERDMKIKKEFMAQGIKIKSYQGNLLHEPWEIMNKQGTYFKVFTAFWKKCLTQPVDITILPTPALKPQKLALNSDLLNSWKLLPTKPNWAQGLSHTWQPGELAAQEQFAEFISERLKNYSMGRDFPAQNATSRLSPYLHFGEISCTQIWKTIKELEAHHPSLGSVCEHFLREIGWREFSYHLLYHFPKLPEENFQKKFNYFSWESNKKLLSAWQKGQTGYPIIDAGMRELWYSGYMHNRVRMITASFLTKHLLIDWRDGAQWFWNTLVDADLANNSMSWQWVAGSGVDSAPYYRIFNPILQSEKFDKEGEYIRRWVPELSRLSNKDLHQPWTTPKNVLRAAGLILGKDYPEPVVEHEFARERALARYKDSKDKN